MIQEKEEGSVFVCSGCYNKNTINWVANKPQKFLTVLEAGKSKKKAPAYSVSDEDTLPKLIDIHIFTVFSYVGRGKGALCLQSH